MTTPQAGKDRDKEIDEAARRCVDNWDADMFYPEEAAADIAALVRREVERERVAWMHRVDDIELRAICPDCWGDGERVPHTDEEAEQDDPRICPTATSHPIADTGDYGTHCNCPKVPCSRCEKGKRIAAERAVEQAVAKEREGCEQACESVERLARRDRSAEGAHTALDCLAAIRARSQGTTGG